MIKEEILNWFTLSSLRPARRNQALDGQTEEVYFAVICGVRYDFNSLKIHLARYPETFINMNYAKSEAFSLENFFSDGSQREDKIQALGLLLKDIALGLKIPDDSRYIEWEI